MHESKLFAILKHMTCQLFFV